MGRNSSKIDVYLEIGKKRTFAGAIDWPGWSRSGRDEGAALQSLLDYGLRYDAVIRPAQLGFHVPVDLSVFKVVERVEGDTSTDFGVPAVIPKVDSRLVGPDELRRFQAALDACWEAFAAALQASAGKELRKGPRGGGRDQDAILEHVLAAESAYLVRLGWKLPKTGPDDAFKEIDRIRQAVPGALAAAVGGELPTRGPRGGTRWPPRYYTRRSAWHILDHAWEIEDRSVLPENSGSADLT